MKFESVELLGSRQDPSTYLNAYGRWFHDLMIEAFGNNLGRKRHMQPISYAFVDVPLSRGNCPRQNAHELLKSGLVHIHAVIALRPGGGQKLRRPLLVAGSAHQLRRYGDVLIEPFDPAKGSLENLIKYCMKGAEAVGRFHRSDTYDLFPRFKNMRASPSADIPR